MSVALADRLAEPPAPPVARDGSRWASATARRGAGCRDDDPPSVLIVEDDDATRRHLVEAVRGTGLFRVLTPCATLRDARAALADAAPRLLLADLGLPDGSGLELIRDAARSSTEIDALVITVFGDERHVLDAVEAGATGYLLKDGDAKAVGEALTDVLDGGSPISPSIARHLLRRFRQLPTPDAAPAPAPAQPCAGSGAGLTPREVQVLRLIAKGLSYTEIALALEMSAHTVTSHIKHIYRKLAVRSRGEAVFEAAQLGLVQFERVA